MHLPVAERAGVDATVELARNAEALGYDRAWVPETWGRNAVATLSAMAERTDSIGIGASVLNTYSRSPALLGQSAASLQELSDGRFRLGVGPSGPRVIEGWHGESFDRPLRRTRECVEIVRDVLDGDPVDYDGDCFSLSGFRLRQEPPEPAPKIDATGMGPKAVELAGRFADGWHAIMLTPDGLRDRLEDFRRGAALGDRDPEDLRCTLSVRCCALEDGERARAVTRRHVAFYVGAMGTFYRDALARQGYPDRADAIATAWAEGDREHATELVDDDLLDRLCAAGRPEHARERLATFAAIDGVDAVSVGFPREATAEEISTTLEALAPS